MEKAFLVANRYRDDALQSCLRLMQSLKANGVQALLEANTAAKLGMDAFEGDIAEAEIAIALGGDGTILHTVHIAAPNDIPILGINMGNLGFLSEGMPDDIDNAIRRIIDKDYKVQERSMLQVSVPGKVEGQIALNEFSLTRGSRLGVTHAVLCVGDDEAGRDRGDGLIVCTPTGSTAYSLSAGGPIVGPGVKCMLVTPICAHSLSSRPIVVSDDLEISIHIEDDFGDYLLSADGQKNYVLDFSDEIMIKKSDKNAKFVKLVNFDFYRQLRRKLSEW